MKRLWSKDLNFLFKNAERNNSDAILALLNKIESTKTENHDYYLLDLNELERDLIEDFLTDLISEIGIGKDDEINQTGRYIDSLIDILNTRDIN